jgi:hypothetical protein
VWRGPLGDVTARAQAGKPRGEHVIVLGPPGSLGRWPVST